MNIVHAARIGDLEMMKREHELGAPWHDYVTFWAANNGHLDCLTYAHEHGAPLYDNAAKFAAMGGHLECLVYLHEHGAPWEDTASIAALYGRLECLRYAHENGAPWDEMTTTYAAYNGHIECLRFAVFRGCPCSPLKDLKKHGMAASFILRWRIAAGRIGRAWRLHKIHKRKRAVTLIEAAWLAYTYTPAPGRTGFERAAQRFKCARLQ